MTYFIAGWHCCGCKMDTNFPLTLFAFQSHASNTSHGKIKTHVQTGTVCGWLFPLAWTMNSQVPQNVLLNISDSCPIIIQLEGC